MVYFLKQVENAVKSKLQGIESKGKEVAEKIINKAVDHVDEVANSLDKVNNLLTKVKTTSNVLGIIFVVFLVKYRFFVLASIKKSFKVFNKKQVVGGLLIVTVSIPVFLVSQPRIETIKKGEHNKTGFKGLPKYEFLGYELSAKNYRTFLNNDDDSLVIEKIMSVIGALTPQQNYSFYYLAFYLNTLKKLFLEMDFDLDKERRRNDLITRLLAYVNCQYLYFNEWIFVEKGYKPRPFGWLPFREAFKQEHTVIPGSQLVSIVEYYLTKYDPFLSHRDNFCWSPQDVYYLSERFRASANFLADGWEYIDITDNTIENKTWFLRPERTLFTVHSFGLQEALFEYDLDVEERLKAPQPFLPLSSLGLEKTVSEDEIEKKVQIGLFINRLKAAIITQKEELFYGSDEYLKFEDEFLPIFCKHIDSGLDFNIDFVRNKYLEGLKIFLKKRVFEGSIVYSSRFRREKYNLSVNGYLFILDYFLKKYDPTSTTDENLFVFGNDMDLLAGPLGITLTYPPHSIDRERAYADYKQEKQDHYKKSLIFQEFLRDSEYSVVDSEADLDDGVDKKSAWQVFLSQHQGFDGEAYPDERKEKDLDWDDILNLEKPLTTMLYSDWRGNDAEGDFHNVSFFSNPVDPELDNLVSGEDNSPYNLMALGDLEIENDNSLLSSIHPGLEADNSIQTRLEADNVTGLFEKNPVFFGTKYPLRRNDNFLSGTTNQVKENSLSFLYRSSICETELDINYIIDWYIDVGQKTELLYSAQDWILEWFNLFPPLNQRFLRENFSNIQHYAGGKVQNINKAENNMLWLLASYEQFDWASMGWAEDKSWQLDWIAWCNEKDYVWTKQSTRWYWYEEDLFNYYTGGFGTPENYRLGFFIWEDDFETFNTFETVSLNNETVFDWDEDDLDLLEWDEYFTISTLFKNFLYSNANSQLPQKHRDALFDALLPFGIIVDDVKFCFTGNPTLFEKKTDYNALLTDKIIDKFFPLKDNYLSPSSLPSEQQQSIQQIFSKKFIHQHFFDLEELPLNMWKTFFTLERLSGAPFNTHIFRKNQYLTSGSLRDHGFVSFPYENPSRDFFNFCNEMYIRCRRGFSGFFSDMKEWYKLLTTTKGYRPYFVLEILQEEDQLGAVDSFNFFTLSPENSRLLKENLRFSEFKRYKDRDLKLSDFFIDDTFSIPGSESESEYTEEGEFGEEDDLCYSDDDSSGNLSRLFFLERFFSIVQERTLLPSGLFFKPYFVPERHMATPRYSNNSSVTSNYYQILKFVYALIEKKYIKSKELKTFESFHRFKDDFLLPIKWKRPIAENSQSPNLFNHDFYVRKGTRTGYSEYYEMEINLLKLLRRKGHSLYPFKFFHKLRLFASKTKWYRYYLKKLEKTKYQTLYFKNFSNILKSIVRHYNEYILDSDSKIDSKISLSEEISIYNHYSEDLRNACKVYNPNDPKPREFTLFDLTVTLSTFQENQPLKPIFRPLRRVRRKKREGRRRALKLKLKSLIKEAFEAFSRVPSREQKTYAQAIWREYFRKKKQVLHRKSRRKKAKKKNRKIVKKNKQTNKTNKTIFLRKKKRGKRKKINRASKQASKRFQRKYPTSFYFFVQPHNLFRFYKKKRQGYKKERLRRGKKLKRFTLQQRLGYNLQLQKRRRKRGQKEQHFPIPHIFLQAKKDQEKQKKKFTPFISKDLSGKWLTDRLYPKLGGGTEKKLNFEKRQEILKKRKELQETKKQKWSIRVEKKPLYLCFPAVRYTAFMARKLTKKGYSLKRRNQVKRRKLKRVLPLDKKFASFKVRKIKRKGLKRTIGFYLKKYKKVTLRFWRNCRKRLALKGQIIDLLNSPRDYLPLAIVSFCLKLLFLTMMITPLMLSLRKSIRFSIRSVHGFIESVTVKNVVYFLKKPPRTYEVMENSLIVLNDLVGVNPILPELCEIVLFLKTSTFNRNFNKKFQKKYLFIGPPGTGKTFLVKAIAGQAKVPVVVESVSKVIYSGYNTLFTRKNVIRLNDTFKKAKRLAPCILFIDEIDTISTGRTAVQTTGRTPLFDDFLSSYNSASKIKKTYASSSHRNIETGGLSVQDFLDRKISVETEALEREKKLTAKVLEDKAYNVLLQLLIELDNLSENDGVLVVGSTNRPQVLDPALVRVGRLSTPLWIQRPGKKKRIDILKLHSKEIKNILTNPKKVASQTKTNVVLNFNKKLAEVGQQISSEILKESPVGVPNFSKDYWEYLGNITHGFSAADLATVVRYSYLQAILQNTKHTIETFEKGIDYITTTNKEKREEYLTPFAYYQAGKAVVHNLLPLHPVLHNIALFPKEKHFRRKESLYSTSNVRFCAAIENRLIGFYAGKAAELLFLSLKENTKKQENPFNKIKEKYQNSEPSLQSFLCQTTFGVEELAAASNIIYYIVERLYLSTNLNKRTKTHILTSKNTTEFTKPDDFGRFLRLTDKISPPDYRINFPELLDPLYSLSPGLLVTPFWREQKAKILGSERDNVGSFYLKWVRFQRTEAPSYVEDYLFLRPMAVFDKYFYDYITFQTRNHNSVKLFNSCAEKTTYPFKGTRNKTRKSNFKKNTLSTLFSFKNFTNRKDFSQLEKKGRLNLLPKSFDDHQIREATRGNITWNDLYTIDADYISHTLIYSYFNQAFCLLDENREVLDYLVDYLMRFEIIREYKINEILFCFGLPTWYKSESESGIKNKQTTYPSQQKQKKDPKKGDLGEKLKNKEKINYVFAKKDSQRVLSRFFTFNQ